VLTYDVDRGKTIHVTDSLRQKAFADRVEPLRIGSGELRVVDIELLSAGNEETDTLPFEANAHVRVYFHTFKATHGNVAVTLGIYDKNGIQILHFNSLVHGIDATKLAPKNSYAIDFKFKCPLTPGEYSLAAGIAAMKRSPTTNAQMITDNVIDYCVGGARFSVLQPEITDYRDLWGISYTECDVSLMQIS
jgi:lipopolysaccharide transport system ATP-binding protein